MLKQALNFVHVTYPNSNQIQGGGETRVAAHGPHLIPLPEWGHSLDSPRALPPTREMITHFTDRESEAQSAYTTCPRPHGEWSWVLNIDLSDF